MILSTGTDPTPEVDRVLKSETGLLVSDGRLYACEPYAHDRLARSLGYRYDDGFSADAGLIRLSCGQWLRPWRSDPTQGQFDTIFLWCERRQRPLPFWLAFNEREPKVRTRPKRRPNRGR